MLNNKGFLQIADKDGDAELMIQKSDSDVYKLGNDCYKYYPELNEDVINQYHVLQNRLSRFGIKVGLDNTKKSLKPIDLSEINTSKLGINLNGETQINDIIFQPLNLGNNINFDTLDIENKEKIVISKVPYVDGNTLFDLCADNYNNEEFFINIYNILKELNNIYAGYYMGAPLNFSMQVRSNSDKFQIHGINCKIIDFKNGTLFITITDLARNIGEFVENNKSRIQSIMQ